MYLNRSLCARQIFPAHQQTKPMKILPFLLAIVAASVEVPAQPVAIMHVTVVDVVASKKEPDQTVLIDSGRIIAVGPTSKVKLPLNCTRIDGTGKFAMPGMTDAHIHFFQSGGLYTRPDGLNLGAIYSYEKDQQWIKENLDDQMARYLACGVTTVIDVGGPFSNYSVRDHVNANPRAPHAFVTGPLISTYLPNNLDKRDPPILKVTTPAEARELVKKQVPYRPDFIKIWYIVLPGEKAESNLPIVQAAIEESHANGLKVCVHATEYQTAKLAVQAGADILVHSVDDEVLDESVLTLLKSRKIVYIPTLLVGQNYTRTFSQRFNFSNHDFKYANPFMLGTLMDLQHIDTLVSRFNYRNRKGRIPGAEDSIMAINLKAVQQRGGWVVSGTDAGNIGTLHGTSYLAELLAMRNCGLSNWEVLQSATINAARGFGHDNDYGSLQKGKIADLLLLDKDPTADLSALEEIGTVFHNGLAMTPAQLLPVSSELLVQQQLNAFNAKNLDAFLEPYADDVKIYMFPDSLATNGKADMRKGYTFLTQTPDLHCEVTERIVQGNTVIDHEKIIVSPGTPPITAVSVYQVENGKIKRVYFMR